MIKIAGTGSYLPEKILTNHDLEQMVETSDEWINQRTGISERRIAADDQATSDLAAEAAKKAIEAAGMKPSEIEMIILGTSTPDYHVPTAGPIIQQKIGCPSHIPAFDMNSICSSFMYSLVTGYSMIYAGFYSNCLVIGADTYSRILNWEDRNTCVLFGDGAGAVVLKKDDSQKKILSSRLGSDGTGSDYIINPVGGSKLSLGNLDKYKKEDLFFQMNGRKVYEFTISVIPKMMKELIAESGLHKDDIDWIILHQANSRIIATISRMLDIDIDKFIVNIEKVGNTSSGSIPIALDYGVKEGKIQDGDKVMMVGFGGGLSWGGLIFEW